MIIAQGPKYTNVLRQLPGTPVVAVDANDMPVAFGTCLSTDEDARGGELSQFTSYAFAHSKKVGDMAGLLSSSLNLGADQLPEFAHPISQATTVVALISTGVALGKEVNDGDSKTIAIAAFKFGANALDAVDKFVPGYPLLHTAALTAKVASSIITVIPDATNGLSDQGS